MSHPRALLATGTLLSTDPAGDIIDPAGHGLFREDTRHLSGWRLSVDGAAPAVLTCRRGSSAAHLVLAPARQRNVDPPYTVFRAQSVDRDGLAEMVTVANHLDRPVRLVLAYAVEVDFADQFELRTGRVYQREGAARAAGVDAGALWLTYDRADFHRATTVRADPEPEVSGSAAGGYLLRWTLDLRPHGTRAVRLEVVPGAPAGAVVREPRAVDGAEPDGGRFDPDAVIVGLGATGRPDQVPGDVPARPTGGVDDLSGLPAAVRYGVVDLTSLLIPSPLDPGERLVAAGAPWFLALFGRDTLLTSCFAAPAAPWLTAAALRALAATQGRQVEPERAEEPGKILHELRVGELSHFGDVPFGRYYGTVDATPLFALRLAECGDDALAVELEPAARAAVEWMFRYGGLDDAGYLVYRTDGPGLVHHGWKDSPRGICFRSGAPAEGTLALCEVQGYAHAALRGTARLARRLWRDVGYADRLDRHADQLRKRFLADFWLPADDFIALAVDGDGRRVDALSSNPGHLLWMGVLDPARGERVGRRLAEPDFFSGWGIRTVAAGQPVYHPLSYHNGAVWPHDTAIAVAGLARYGLRDEARRIAAGLLAAGAHHGHRLPEVLAGYGRDESAVPVPYPHSCSPQAWAAAAPLLLARALNPANPG